MQKKMMSKSLKNKVSHQVFDQATMAIIKFVEDEVEGRIWFLPDQVEDQVHAQVHAQVHTQVIEQYSNLIKARIWDIRPLRTLDRPQAIPGTKQGGIGRGNLP